MNTVLLLLHLFFAGWMLKNLNNASYSWHTFLTFVAFAVNLVGFLHYLSKVLA